MTNLNDAFLKAYAKRPASNAQVQGNTPERPTRSDHAAPNYFASASASEPIAPHISEPAVRGRQLAESGTSAVVSSTRSPSRSATVRKKDLPHVATSRMDGPGDRHFRVDEPAKPAIDPSVLAAAQQSAKPAIDPSVLAATQQPAKQVRRQSLADYLADMRQRISETEELVGEALSDAPLPTQKTQHVSLEQKMQRASAPAVYGYPDMPKTAGGSVTKAAANAPTAFVDKRTLRQLASSSGPVSSEQSEKASTSAPKHAVAESVRSETHAAPIQKAPTSTRVQADPRSKMEPVTVRETWREAERTYRVDSINQPVSKPSAEPQKPLAPKAEQKPAKEMQNRRIDDKPAQREQPAHLRNDTNSASVAMVESLASYNPNSEISALYRETKISNAPDKSRAEQRLAQSNKAIVAPLNPEWEVDTFQWPFTVLDLLAAQEQAFDEIASHLLAANRKGLKTVAITSAERGVGKSTTCMSLGALMAHKGLKVAIIDGDVENPSLFNQLFLEFPHGWQDCIRDNVPLESVAVKSLEENVTLFPLTDSMNNDEVSSNRIKINHLLRRIAKSYDMVFIDTHRISYRSNQLIGTGDDAAIDAALVVVDSELSVKERIDTTLQILHDQKINSIGVVENFSNLDLPSDQDS